MRNAPRPVLAATALSVLAACGGAPSSTAPGTAPAAVTVTRVAADGDAPPQLSAPTSLLPAQLPLPPGVTVEPTVEGGLRVRIPEARLGFSIGSSQLGPQADEVLRPIADLLVTLRSRDRAWTVVCEGHASTDGDREENDRLAAARATATAERLATLGAPANALRHAGFGATRPLTPTGLEPENRRVEIRFEQASN